MSTAEDATAASETAMSPRTRISIDRYCTARRAQVLLMVADTARKALAF
jgi:hypothetical protein